MKAILVGIERDIDYKNKEGKHVQGIRLHTIRNSVKVDGQEAEVIFIKKEYADRMPAIPSLKTDMVIAFERNRYGGIEDVTIVE